jgi:hypothetical protein
VAARVCRHKLLLANYNVLNPGNLRSGKCPPESRVWLRPKSYESLGQGSYDTQNEQMLLSPFSSWASVCVV